MPTNLAIDDNLILEAQKISGISTKKETVDTALREFIIHHKQEEIIEMFGSVEYENDYDYKKMRNRK
ncbi:MAG: type II toxin-antitoxin system VapB family antitoxin [Candidatus Delongbacteria bacterium]|nr:type II toxin-antitoxin system VapB family antitoxin [Candidatus Delongbacteria bacterium]